MSLVIDYSNPKAINSISTDIECLMDYLLYLRKKCQENGNFEPLEALTPHLDELAGTMEDFFCLYCVPKEE